MKCIDLRPGKQEVQKKKPIEIVKIWFDPIKAVDSPDVLFFRQWEVLECVMDWEKGQLMYAYDKDLPKDEGIVCWGYWNDGVIE